MVKKALCIGCNYPSKAFGLAGAVNDAFLIADCLQKNFDFEPENVCVLHDIHPGQKKSMKVEPAKKPTRVNILQRLQWLVRNARQGDVLFFSFSGYGLQVDDMDGYQDEGFDEAILPTDFVDGRDGDYTVIVTDDIHDILMGIPPNCQVTVLMDCDHATSVVDVSGTLDGGLVNGLKYQTYCGLKVHTTKVQLALHNREVWQEERARLVKARPRFQPMMEIDNPRKGRLPTRPAMSRSSPVAFCYSAAAHGQTAMEMQMSRVVDGKDVPKQHGVLTWCFVQALEELRFECTHNELIWAVRRHMAVCKEKDLPRLDQEVLLTFSTPLSNPQTMKVLQPLPLMVGVGGRGTSIPLGSMTLGGENDGKDFYDRNNLPEGIVPPPPVGFITGSGDGTGGTGAGAGAGGPPPSRPGGGAGGRPHSGDSPGQMAHQAQMDQQWSPQAQMEPAQQWAPQVQTDPPQQWQQGPMDRPPSPTRPEGSHRAAAREAPPPPPPPPRLEQQRQGGPPSNAAWDDRMPASGAVENQYAPGYGNGPEQANPYAGAVSPREFSTGSNAAAYSGAAPATGESPERLGNAPLIPNFFNMQPMGQQPIGSRGMQPMSVPPHTGAPQNMRGLTPPNLAGGLLGQNSFQQPTRALSQQGMSFSMPAGVGMPQAPGAAIPAATQPSFRVGPTPQMVAPGRGTSLQGYAPRR